MHRSDPVFRPLNGKKVKIVIFSNCLIGKDIEEFKQAFKADLIMGFNGTVAESHSDNFFNIVLKNYQIYMKINKKFNAANFLNILKDPKPPYINYEKTDAGGMEEYVVINSNL